MCERACEYSRNPVKIVRNGTPSHVIDLQSQTFFQKMNEEGARNAIFIAYIEINTSDALAKRKMRFPTAKMKAAK